MSKIWETVKNVSPFNGRTEMPKLLYVIKVIIIFYVFKFGSELAGEVLALGIHFACGKNPLQGEMFDASTITVITYLGNAFMTGVIFLLWKLFQKKKIVELGFTKSFGSYFIGMAVGAGLLLACVVPVVCTGTITFNGIFSNIDVKMVLLMIPCFIFQGAMEEVLCRGIVQQLLIKKTNAPVAVGVSAILFTVVHLSNMGADGLAINACAVINLLLISVVFSILTLRFKSIWAACGMHSVWNYMLYSIMGLNLSGDDEIVASVFDMRSVGSNVLNGGTYGVEASIITAAVMGIVVFLGVMAWRRDAKKGECLA